MTEQQAAFSYIGQARAPHCRTAPSHRFGALCIRPSTFQACCMPMPVGATIAKGKVLAIDTSRTFDKCPACALYLSAAISMPMTRIKPSFGDALMLD